jgi:hypothetical protein
MEFVKKHYEKIILSVVLLGLVGALVFLPFMIASDKQKVSEAGNIILSPKVVPLPELNVTNLSNVLQRLQSPYDLDLATTNRLFNPVEWQRAADNSLIKLKTGKEVGVEAATVTKITPLYLSLTLDGVQTNELSTVYIIGVERQAAPTPAMRRKQQRYAALSEKKDVFTITKVEGAPENPGQLVLKLADSGEAITLARGKPFQRVEAYAADLRYDPEKKNFLGRREGMPLSFGGEDYIIVAIHQNEVIMSAQSNQKKTTLQYAP